MHALTRSETWPEAFERVVERHRRLPFAWGSNDCLGFALDVVKEMTGFDPREGGEQLTYKDRAQAMAVLHERGFDNLTEALRAHFPEIQPINAGRGDLALLTTDLGIIVGVFAGPMLVVKDVDGVGFVERSRAVVAFKVG